MCELRRLGVIFVLLLVAPDAQGTTFLKMSEEQRIQKADRICAVRVLSAEAAKDKQLGIVTTTASVTPLQDKGKVLCWKNPTSQSFRVKYLGGTAEGETTRVPGAPNLKAGEELIVFLTKSNDPEVFGILTWQQGVIPVFKENETFYLKRQSRTPPIRAQSSDPKVKSATQAKGPQTLDDFGQRVRSVMSKKK